MLKALVLAGKARALLSGRLAVSEEDIRALALPVLRHRVIAVVDEHKARFSGKAVQPVRQTFPVRVAGQAAELPHRGAHRHRLPEQLDFLCPLQQGAAQRARRLISHEQHGTFRPPKVVFQVMADAARITHTGGGNDDLGRGVGVDGHRIFLIYKSLPASVLTILVSF